MFTFMFTPCLHFNRVETSNTSPSTSEKEEARKIENIIFLTSPLKPEAVEHQYCPTDRQTKATGSKENIAKGRNSAL